MAGFFPDVAVLDEPLLEILRGCRIVFFDGTFWDEDELARLGIGERTAAQMGHVPVFESRKKLAPLAAAGVQIFYLHINNTNPMLRPEAPERLELNMARLRLAEDGMRLTL